AGQADRAHRRFRATGNHADHFDGWHGGNDYLRQLDFQFRRRSEARPFVERGFYRSDDPRMAMSEDERSPRADVIEITVAIDVDQIRPSASLDEWRLAAHAAECPGRTVDAPRNNLRSTLKSLLTASANRFHEVIIRAIEHV